MLLLIPLLLGGMSTMLAVGQGHQVIPVDTRTQGEAVRWRNRELHKSGVKMLRRRKRRRRLPKTVVESPFERQINLLPSRGWKKVRKRRKQKHLSLESDKLRAD